MTDAARFLPLLLDFIQRAGGVAMGFQDQGIQSFKSDKAPVTAADLAISKMFAEFIRTLPDAAAHFVIDEEACGTVSGAQAAWQKAKYVWVIDPIDGTTPFAHGLPLWGTMIALFKNNQPVLGIISNPALDEIVYTDTVQTTYVNRKTGITKELGVVEPQPLHRSSLVFGSNWLCDFDCEPVLFMDLHAAAVITMYAVLGRCRAAFFGPPMSLWDLAITLPFAKATGLELMRVRDGQSAHVLTDITIEDNWKPKDLFVFCHPTQFDELRKLPKA
ncbi:MAG: inositol monophosphatase [Bdellovibrionales bacterium]